MGERARLSSAALSGRLSEMICLLGDDVDSLRVFVLTICQLVVFWNIVQSLIISKGA